MQLYQGRPAAVAVLSSLGGARPVILALGAGPLLLETTFRATAEASATAMANPRRRSRALRCSGAWGLARRASRNNFRATAEASATASLALASVVFALGGWPDGLPETSFRAMKAEGSWNASDRDGRFINQNRTTADGRFHIVPCKEFISGQAEPFLSRAGRIATLSRPASRLQFIKAGQPMAVLSTMAAFQD